MCHTCESGVLKSDSVAWSMCKADFWKRVPIYTAGRKAHRERERETGEFVCVLRSGDGEPYPLWVAGFVSASAFYPLQFAFTFRI